MAKILVVDDEPDLEVLIRQRFRRQIRSGDYEFLFAQNGQEALDTLSTTPEVDIILTDINMPVMDGLTLLLRINELKTVHKAVIVSAYGDLGNIRTAMNRGAFDFITKPIDFNDLEITLDRTRRQLGLTRQALEDHNQLLALRQELDIASNIQQCMLPQVFPSFAAGYSVDVFARMTPALEVGGDFYDFFFLPDRRMGIVVGDVSGKGVSAAIFMAVTRTLLRAAALTGMSAEACITYVNRMLCADNPSEMFVTAFYGILDQQTGDLNFCNAGHNMPVLNRNGSAEILKGYANLVLGTEEEFSFTGGEIKLLSEDCLLLYTDGVTEAENRENQLFGTNRLLETVAAKKAETAEQTLNHVFETVLSYCNSVQVADDLTALAVKFRGMP